MKHRRAAKVDQNQKLIVRQLRQIPNITVAVGHDDILVGYRGRTYWFEIKRPEVIGKDGLVRPSKITDSEKKLRDEWQGHYAVVSTFDEIFKELDAGSVA